MHLYLIIRAICVIRGFTTAKRFYGGNFVSFG
jgi:hypothetical protein